MKFMHKHSLQKVFEDIQMKYKPQLTGILYLKIDYEPEIF